ncbi:DUF4350 domain-containing protein [Stackebrandtia soli]|uniref:DUF4350 domain-containing protein n=1 Tax=Stackebrandtia soli TaxID=1892856 RepID=UPI0039ECAA3F
MTTDTTATAGRTDLPPKRTPFHRRRFLTPLIVAGVLILGTILAVVIEAPYPSRDTFLSPASTSDHGSSALADRLTAAGVSVERHTDVTDAVPAAGAAQGEATVFVSAPAYLTAHELVALIEAADGGRLVVVMPEARTSNAFGLGNGDGRIVGDTVTPGAECALSEATAAGPATVRQDSYVSSTEEFSWGLCYEGGLARAELSGAVWLNGLHDRRDGDDWNEPSSLSGLEVVFVGAADAFTNAHIDEYGNSAFATGLLSRHSRVIWVDDHELPAEEPKPEPSTSASYPSEEESRSPIPIDYGRQDGTNPLYGAFPSWLWAMLVGLLVLGVGVALWRGRRLGPPVLEPLPVSVPGAETAMGRAGLYQRAKAQQRAFDAIRAGALESVRPLLGVSTRTAPADVVVAIAARTGWQPADVHRVLYGQTLTKPADLRDAVAALDALVAAIHQTRPQGRS